MKLLYIGSEQIRAEFAAKFAPTNQIDYEYELESFGGELGAYSAVFDFDLFANPGRLIRYGDSQLIVFANSVLSSLSQIVGDQDPVPFLIGFNGLLTFINRDHLEVTLLPGQSKERLAQICTDLDTNHLLVEDRVGMVSTRVICMIINEAYFTFEEGTASREDIDMAMKLGTNYPYGPFEWADKIGLENVYELLKAVYRDTGDPRYEICRLLQSESF